MLKQQVENFLDESEKQIDSLLQKHNQEITEKIAQVKLELRQMIETAGKAVCPSCGGYGKVIRMDAGYMRKFGLREWDGCKKCGGDHDRSGDGFI